MGRKQQRKNAGQRRGARAAETTVGARRGWFAAAAVLVILVAAVFMIRPAPVTQASPTEPARSTPTAQPGARSLRVEVLRELSHERDAYTQGLVWWNDQLFESTGRNGESTLRRLDPETGRVEQRIDIPAQYFGEGLALVDQRLIMLTWRAQRAFVYQRDSFELQDSYRYRGEGWGLCYDGDRLIMSDGSDRLTFRDPITFDPIGEQRVSLRGQPLWRLNELECVEGAVYANVWEEDFLVRIDPETGQVTEYIDASGLLRGNDLIGAEVLNGIAYDPNAKTFYITGKWWPKMFEVRFVE